jgi:hypothetical protein
MAKLQFPEATTFAGWQNGKEIACKRVSLLFVVSQRKIAALIKKLS